MLIYLLTRYINSPSLYLGLTLFSRFLQGAGSGISQTAFISLITKKYISFKGRMLSFYLLGFISGIKTGPFLGSYLALQFQVTGMFAIMAGLTLIKACAFFFFQDIGNASKFQQFDNATFNIHEVLLKSGPLFAFLNLLVSCLAFLNIEPLLANYWHQLYHISPYQIGFHFFLAASALPILALIFLCFGQNHDHRIIIIFGNILSGLSQFLLAPSAIFGLKQSDASLSSGLVLNTIGVVLSFCFSFQQAWRACLKLSNNPYIYDIITGIMTAVIGLEMTLGPLLISILQFSMGFACAMDIVGLLKIVFTLTYGAHLVKQAVLEKGEEPQEQEEIGLLEET